MCVSGLLRRPTEEARISRRIRCNRCQRLAKTQKTFAVLQKTDLSFVSTYKWGVQKGSKKGLFGVTASYGLNCSHRMQNSPPQFSLICGVFGGFWPFLGTPPKRLVLRPQGLQTLQGLPSRSGEGWPQGPPPPPLTPGVGTVCRVRTAPAPRRPCGVPNVVTLSFAAGYHISFNYLLLFFSLLRIFSIFRPAGVVDGRK
jgi:hypothetical protein